METKEPLVRSDWTIYRGGALFYTGTGDCSLEDCFIDQVGGNAVFVNNYNRFNQEFFANWRRMPVNAVHEAAPGLPVHAKAMTWTMINDGDVK